MTFKDIFPGLSRTLSFNFQDFPGPKWFSRTSRSWNFQEKIQDAWEPCYPVRGTVGFCLSVSFLAKLRSGKTLMQAAFLYRLLLLTLLSWLLYSILIAWYDLNQLQQIRTTAPAVPVHVFLLILLFLLLLIHISQAVVIFHINLWPCNSNSDWTYSLAVTERYQ